MDTLKESDYLLKYANAIKDKLLPYITTEFPGLPNVNHLCDAIISDIASRYSKEQTLLARKPGTEVSDFNRVVTAMLDTCQIEADNISVQFFKKFGSLKATLSASFDIILLIGAAVSFEGGAPLGEQLMPMIKRLGIINDDRVDLNNAFKKLRADPEKVAKFKRRFQSFIIEGIKVEKICIPKSYKVIADRFRRNKVLEIFSLNWDDLIERAYREVNGQEIPKFEFDKNSSRVKDEFVHKLWKLHGDIADIESDWVLPGDKVTISKELLTYAAFLSDQDEKEIIPSIIKD